jgi:hypothetical protein
MLDAVRDLDLAQQDILLQSVCLFVCIPMNFHSFSVATIVQAQITEQGRCI